VGVKFKMDQFTQCLSLFAAEHWKPSLRELTYQHILFHDLYQLYPGQVLVEILLGVSTLRRSLNKDAKALLKKYFPHRKALCPDLIVLDKRIDRCGPRRFIHIKEFPDNLPLAAFVELKVTSASPSATKRAYVSDAAKLQLLGDYWGARTGRTPALIQVIFNWESGNRPALDAAVLRRWYGGGARTAFPNVHVLRIDKCGDCEQLLGP